MIVTQKIKIRGSFIWFLPKIGIFENLETPSSNLPKFSKSPLPILNFPNWHEGKGFRQYFFPSKGNNLSIWFVWHYEGHAGFLSTSIKRGIFLTRVQHRQHWNDVSNNKNSITNLTTAKIVLFWLTHSFGYRIGVLFHKQDFNIPTRFSGKMTDFKLNLIMKYRNPYFPQKMWSILIQNIDVHN